MGAAVSIEGRTLAVISAGYWGKRRSYVRLAELGARLVVIDEPGHWSASLVEDGIAVAWLPAAVTGDPDVDAAAIVDVLDEARIRPDGIVTFWEISIAVAARVAARLGLPGNPPDSVDAARSKVRTRELSTSLGLPTPKARRVRSLDELFAASDYVGFPAVVKPEFGASSVGCIRVDDVESLPKVYSMVRDVVAADELSFFRAGNDLLLEQYLDGVEFDVDLVLEDGECAFSSVSQQSPTAEPAFQETGLHCPPDHSARQVRRLVDLSVQTVQAFGFVQGVMHVEGKCTAHGPRIVEVNARMGGGRIHQIVDAVWGVDLIEAHLRSALGLPQELEPSRKPRCAVVNVLVYAPATGRLEALPFRPVTPEADPGLVIDVAAEVGQEVDGPDRMFSTVLADVYVGAKNLRHGRSLVAEVLRDPPVVVPSLRRPARI
jgi:biotin carboxylase